MRHLLNFPLVFSVIFLVVLWGSAKAGLSLHRNKPGLDEATQQDLDMVRGAILTLLGLIIGFSFAMATSRYDLRKNYEEEEANAIGTEYVRLDLLPESNASPVKNQLVKYLDQRILFYTLRDSEKLAQVNKRTAQLQSDMWTALHGPALAQPTPLTALAVSGMNDVLNSQGYTQAAWWNRIPIEAWALMVTVAIGGNLLVGYGLRSGGRRFFVLFALPLMVAISSFLIADIDSPRGGLVRVTPVNLISLRQSLP